MSRDILEAIHKHNQRKRQASLRYEEMLGRAVEQRIDDLKSDGDDHTPELRAYNIYRRLADEYSGDPQIYLPRKNNKRAVAFWKRVVKRAQEADVELEVFLKAQFEYFHRIFRKAPELPQLTTDNAVMRAREYSKTGGIGKLVGTIKDKQSLAELFSACNKQMIQLQKAQNMTRVEVYQHLVIPGHVYFPQAFLDADPAFQKVKNE